MFLLCIVYFYIQAASCQWLGGIMYNNSEFISTQMQPDRPCHSRRQFACLKKSRMVTSPRAWLFTVTPKNDDTVIYGKKIPDLSIFTQCNLNLMVAFHSVTIQQRGGSGGTGEQRGGWWGGGLFWITFLKETTWTSRYMKRIIHVFKITAQSSGSSTSCPHLLRMLLLMISMCIYHPTMYYTSVMP